MSRTARWLGLGLSLLLVTGALVTSCAKHDGATHAAAAAAKYHCPMHPTYVSDEPGSCPICGMSLTLITEPTGSDSAHGAGGAATSGVEGHAVVELNERELELTGIRTATGTKDDHAHGRQHSPAVRILAMRFVVLNPGRKGMNVIFAFTCSSAARSSGFSFSSV